MKPRILIVDDSMTYRLWLEMMLQGRYEVHTAADGQAAVQCARRIRPHLVLLDVVMPGTDGLAACRALRWHNETKGTPVIFVTTKGEEWDVEAGYQAGGTDYITKPVDQVEFLAKVESWIELSLAGTDP